MYAVVEDRWLISLGEGLTVTDLEENRTFYGRADAELGEFAAVVRASETGRIVQPESTTELHCEYADSGLTVQLSRKTASGLEFKPKKVRLEPAHGSVTIAVKELVLSSRRANSELQEAQSELDRVYEANQTMVEEKREIQDVTLQRICAILEERNFWIEKFRNIHTQGDAGGRSGASYE